MTDLSQHYILDASPEGRERILNDLREHGGFLYEIARSIDPQSFKWGLVTKDDRDWPKLYEAQQRALRRAEAAAPSILHHLLYLARPLDGEAMEKMGAAMNPTAFGKRVLESEVSQETRRQETRRKVRAALTAIVEGE